jgi:hypothetical protein
MYLWTNELADQGKRTMEKKHVSFTKDGMKVGVKELGDEEYADKTQRYEWLCGYPRGPLQGGGVAV